MNELLILHKDMHKYNTRNKNDIHATQINNMTYGSRKLGYRGRSFWNNLPRKKKLPQIPSKINLNNTLFQHIDFDLILSAYNLK